MKDYELSVLFHPDLEMNLDPALNKVKKLIGQNGGKITKEENEGKKRLAYPIKGQEFAVFYYFNVSFPADGPKKLSDVLNITDEVIRYLLVREDELKAKLEARRKAKADAKEDTKEETIEEKGE